MDEGDTLKLIRGKGVEIQRLNIKGTADKAVGEIDPGRDTTM